ncbi:hypothetical protein KGF56_002202 [Candida oxycetoniae]|uniref:Uncharacterized protein n=1 Tax=Candida oxycetoniae TaxID=497107 RepID=A0AAI9SYD8_9ASCO|nr:uncharacterized protein KGF56_002202 [Candida oxycetoniae]KAI3405037.2 hypothetical protein KGF56_002202 [Candida oxycetoniae]
MNRQEIPGRIRSEMSRVVTTKSKIVESSTNGEYTKIITFQNENGEETVVNFPPTLDEEEEQNQKEMNYKLEKEKEKEKEKEISEISEISETSETSEKLEKSEKSEKSEQPRSKLPLCQRDIFNSQSRNSHFRSPQIFRNHVQNIIHPYLKNNSREPNVGVKRSDSNLESAKPANFSSSSSSTTTTTTSTSTTTTTTTLSPPSGSDKNHKTSFSSPSLSLILNSTTPENHTNTTTSSSQLHAPPSSSTTTTTTTPSSTSSSFSSVSSFSNIATGISQSSTIMESTQPYFTANNNRYSTNSISTTKPDSVTPRIAQLGQRLIKYLNYLGVISYDFENSSPSQSRSSTPASNDETTKKRSNIVNDLISKRRTLPEKEYNCKLEFELCCHCPIAENGKENVGEKEEKEKLNGNTETAAGDNEQFKVVLKLRYKIKKNINQRVLPLNLYITNDELVRYLIQCIVFGNKNGESNVTRKSGSSSRSESESGTTNSGAKNPYSIQDKIKILLDLKEVKCFINGYELEL